MDKPIHTLQEWQEETKSRNANWNADRILRDWGRDREILKAQIAELENSIQLLLHITDGDKPTIDLLTKKNKILYDSLVTISRWLETDVGSPAGIASAARQAAKDINNE